MQLKSKEGLKDYLPVPWRLAWILERCQYQGVKVTILEKFIDPKMSITKETQVWNNDRRKMETIQRTAEGFAWFTMRVEDPYGNIGEGFGSECAVDFPDYAEKAQTKAIGRALGFIGYGTQYTGGEFDERVRIVDSPLVTATHEEPETSPRSSVPSASGGESMATDQQVASLRKLCQHLGRAEPEHLEALPSLEAKEMIAQLSLEYRTSREKQDPSPAQKPGQKEPQVSKPAILSSQPIVQQTNKPVPVPAKGEPSNGHKPVQQSQAQAQQKNTQGTVAVAEQPEVKLARPFTDEFLTALEGRNKEAHTFLVEEVYPVLGPFEQCAFRAFCTTQRGVPGNPVNWNGAIIEFVSVLLKDWCDAQKMPEGGRALWQKMKSVEEQKTAIADITAQFGLPATLTFQRSFARIAQTLPVNMTAALADHWIDCLHCAVQDEETGVLSLPPEKEAPFADLRTVETQPEQAA